jgi:Flp pilus assembly secretin CpaC
MKRLQLVVLGLLLSGAARGADKPAITNVAIDMAVIEIVYESDIKDGIAPHEPADISLSPDVLHKLYDGHLVDINSLVSNGEVNLMSGLNMSVVSGTRKTTKMVTEYSYPIEYKIQPTLVTNGTKVISGVAVLPGNLQTQDVGVVIEVLPEYQAERDLVAIDLSVQIVSEPTWRKCVTPYQGADGSQQILTTEQPIFGVRKIAQYVVMHRGETLLLRGVTTSRIVHVDDRVPVLGYIPLLGRLFRDVRDVRETRTIMVALTADVRGQKDE